MRENSIRKIWARGGTVINSWCWIPSSFAAEVMAHQGWDSLTVDMQHGVIDYRAVVEMLTAISTTSTVPLVRVPWLDPGIVMKVLDAGAYGVICPMVNTAAQAEQFVAATRYPPEGDRSYGPIRAALYGGPDYARSANDTIVRFAMIETLEALDNVDAIMAVPGLDAVYVGPTDLSCSMGYEPAGDREEKPVLEALDLILSKAKEHGLMAGLHTFAPDYALRMVEKGFRFVTIDGDARFVAAAAGEAVRRVREGMGG